MAFKLSKSIHISFLFNKAWCFLEVLLIALGAGIAVLNLLIILLQL